MNRLIRLNKFPYELLVFNRTKQERNIKCSSSFISVILYSIQIENVYIHIYKVHITENCIPNYIWSNVEIIH